MDPEKFLQYDAENPKIWSEFEALALELIRHGKKHYSAYAIMVNNNYRSGYARKFAAKYPQFKRFFELREKRRAVRGMA